MLFFIIVLWRIYLQLNDFYFFIIYVRPSAIIIKHNGCNKMEKNRRMTSSHRKNLTGQLLIIIKHDYSIFWGSISFHLLWSLIQLPHKSCFLSIDIFNLLLSLFLKVIAIDTFDFCFYLLYSIKLLSAVNNLSINWLVN